MPNYVTNEIIFGGNAEMVAKVIAEIHKVFDEEKEYVKDGNIVGVMNHFIPMPKIYDVDTTSRHYKDMVVGDKLWDFENNREIVITEELINKYREAEHEQATKYGAVGWYDWRCKNWGTKWDMFNCSFGRADGVLWCCTAWRPPIEFLRTLTKMYEGLTVCLMFNDEFDNKNYSMFFENGTFRENGDVDDEFAEMFSDDEEDCEEED